MNDPNNPEELLVSREAAARVAEGWQGGNTVAGKRIAAEIRAMVGIELRYLQREGATDLLHDGATDDPNNKDWPSERVAPADNPEIEELLPCPFCGGKAYYSWNEVQRASTMAMCMSCGASAFWVKWNTRQPSSRDIGLVDGRDLSGETVMGMRVAAYRETHPEHGDRFGHRYSEHWSTPSQNPRVKVERLFTEQQVRELLAAIRQPSSRDIGLEEALTVVRNTVGDLRNGFSKAVDPARWVEQLQAYIDAALSNRDDPPAL